MLLFLLFWLFIFRFTLVVLKGAEWIVSLVVFDLCNSFFRRRVGGRSLSFEIISRSAFLKRFVIAETGGSVEFSGECWEFGFLFMGLALGLIDDARSGALNGLNGGG